LIPWALTIDYQVLLPR